jgi:sirohydrochlorin cobaltochelatase
MTTSPTPGLLLFAHGARDPLWARPFNAVLAQARAARPDLHIALAYLEFMRPNLQTAGAELAALGCSAVKIVPLFLGAGGHVRKDLPVLLTALEAQHPEVDWQLSPAIGEMDSVVSAIALAALSQCILCSAPLT